MASSIVAPKVLTDADIEKLPPLTDADIEKHEAPATHESSALSDFAHGTWSKLNPIEIVKGMGETAKQFGEHPIDTALSVLAHPYLALKRSKEAMDAGKFEEAAAHFQSALSPAGFVSEGSQVKAATPGKRAEGLGELLGTGLAAYLGGKSPEIIQGVKNAPGAIAALPGKIADAASSPAGSAFIEGAKKVPVFPRTLEDLVAPLKAARNAWQDAAAEQFLRETPPSLPAGSPGILLEPVVPRGTEAPPSVESPVNTEAVPIQHPPFAKTAPFSPSRAARQQYGTGTLAEQPKSSISDMMMNVDSPFLKAKDPVKALTLAKRLAEALKE